MTLVDVYDVAGLAARTVTRAYRTGHPDARAVDAAHGRLVKRGLRGRVPADDPDVAAIVTTAVVLAESDRQDARVRWERQRAAQAALPPIITSRDPFPGEIEDAYNFVPAWSVPADTPILSPCEVDALLADPSAAIRELMATPAPDPDVLAAAIARIDARPSVGALRRARQESS